MKLIEEAKLFVRTLSNDKYVYNDSVLIEEGYQRSFYGLSKKIDRLARYSLIKYSLIVFFPFMLVVFLTFELFKSTICVIRSKNVKLSDNNYFIAATIFSRSVNNRINKYIGDACWILNRNITPADFEIRSRNSVSCYQLISLLDVIVSVIETMITYVLICKRYGVFYMLDTLNATSWFLFYRACKRIPQSANIFFCNQKDRWAFLEDQINCKYKTLIQHGTEIVSCSEIEAQRRGLISMSLVSYAQNLPNKFTTINSVVAFSEKEKEAMKMSILNCEPDFKISGYEFETYSLDSKKYAVLIIAHSGLYFEKEQEIIKALQNLDIDIYVKNHPTQNNDGYNELLNENTFIFITEQKFPHVNLVITYDSTLAHEYKSVGIEVVFHTQNSIDVIRNIIVSQL